MPPQRKPDASLKQLQQENAQLRGDLLTISRRVSHDLRTPLGSISISVELIKELLAGNDASPEIMKSLGTALEEINQLIKSLSILARADGDPPPLEKVAMGIVIWDVRQQLERKVTERGANVNASDVWPEVIGCARWLEFIWWNFVSNALQHGGPNIQLGWNKDKDHFRFWVQDDGHNLSESTRELLFQPFDTLHQPDSTRGLGLSIVQRLVELQGGNCGCETTVAGPLFYFTLPEIRD